MIEDGHFNLEWNIDIVKLIITITICIAGIMILGKILEHWH